MNWLPVFLAIILLNASLTFGSVWPTLLVRLSAAISAELAILVMALVLVRRRFGPISPRFTRWFAVVWMVLVVGRYADVTVRALYGRRVNLYWDLKVAPDVGAMFAVVASSWLAVAFVAGLVLLPVLLYIPLRWALGRLIDAVNDPRAHRVLNLTSAAALVMGLAGTFEIRGSIGFAQPVTPTYAAAITEFAYEMTGAGVRALGPAPSMESNMVRIHGADVFLIFLESYGVTSWDRPEFARPLAESRARFEHDIRESGRSVVSARVESTTFGGESWLAHISLISGTEVRDQRTNVRLMAQERDTLVKAFGRRGYRTVAIMPGLLREWPQGGFYGFDEVYNLERLDYQGPPFGWWSITDQFALARMDALEVANRREKPLFVFFPTISTHAPFTPAPPYQADWARILTPDPYDQADLERAWIGEPDWGDLGPSYVEGMKYAYATLGGYLRFRTGRDWVVMVIGDHQPPALVTGENAPHDVPAHIIASRQDLLDRFKQRGFRDGLAPHSPPVARMDTLLPILLDAFGDVVPQPQTVGRVFSSSAAAHQ